MPISLDPVARLVVEEHAAAPGAVVAASLRDPEKGQVQGLGAWGRLTAASDAPGVDVRTPFDLASLTKPLVALTLARLERRAALARTELLGEVVPALAKTPAGSAPLDLLASHRAGLEAHQQLHLALERGEYVDRDAAFLSAACALRSGCEGRPPIEGFSPIYSDMGYLLLGLAIETRMCASLDAVVQAEVLAPLGLIGRIGSARQLAVHDSRFMQRVAPTEHVAFRGGVVRGAVHDENAFALSADAISGHAGLFGDAEAVLAVGQAVLAASRSDDGWLGPRDLEPLLKPRAGGSLLAGFDARGADRPSCGSRLGPRTFGHLGFTGTSVWIDPGCDFVGVLLTNRVHPTRDHIAIRAARPAAYDAMFDALALSS